jgi:pimeloyl-ACP methyl ester carboxylesterase
MTKADVPEGAADTRWKHTPTRTIKAGAVEFAYRRAILAGTGPAAPHDLGKIRQPVLVANGDNDVMVASEHSADMARRLPNAKLVIYPDSGHGGVFQYHQQFVPEVLEFLER